MRRAGEGAKPHRQRSQEFHHELHERLGEEREGAGAIGARAQLGLCHCIDCQKFSGSAFAKVIGVPTASLEVTGTLKTFTKPGDSGRPMHRRFCPGCGSGVIDEAEALPGVAMINAGTLDDRSWIKPASAIYCDSAHPWVELSGEMQHFAKAPG